jgi:predicted MFS family arabinose efflux permease
MPTFSKLALVWASAHTADQLMLAWVPLYLVAQGASAGMVSAVVAAHAAAWLLVSLPVGAYADAWSRARILGCGAALLTLGGLLGWRLVPSSEFEAGALAAVSFVVSAGVVAATLSIFALLPQAVASPRLTRANAVLEFLRAAAAIGMPLLAARLLGADGSTLVFALVLGFGLVAFATAAGIAPDARTTANGPTFGAAIREGAAFVATQPLLRAIAVCAISWNLAFFALTAVFAPYAAARLGFGPAETAAAWSAYGTGLVLGSLAAPLMIARIPTGVMFLFGPAMSMASMLLLALFAAPGRPALVWAAFFAIGFGPMTWLVLQTSVRQLVTPPALLGRVGAVVTTAVYGVRPVGALGAGAIAHLAGIDAAIWFASALFAVSFAAIAATSAARLTTLPRPAG